MRSYSPQFQPDQMVLRGLVNRLTRNGTVPIDEVIERLENPNQPPGLINSTYMIDLLTVGGGLVNKPAMLVPKNPRRFSLLVFSAGASGTVYYSFGAPVNPGRGSINLGIPLAPSVNGNRGSPNSPAGGNVSIDDVWVWWTAGSAPLVMAYEGTLPV